MEKQKPLDPQFVLQQLHSPEVSQLVHGETGQTRDVDVAGRQAIIEEHIRQAQPTEDSPSTNR